MEIKIQIKSIFGNVLFEYSKENNTIKDTLCEANLRGANLCEANLRGANLREANLCGANLREANLCGANLREANLRGANLREANLRGADLRGADLCEANLRGANLREANLRGADLRGADLCEADLRGADLRGANLREADLRGADLREANHNEGTAFLLSQCPDGAFIGYKKASSHIVKLLVPEDAKRSSATTLKCRCSKAKVLEIQNLDGSKSDLMAVPSDRDENFIYVVGKEKEVEDFDEDRWNECSTGIHFFISREMAVKY
ncbi:pentapeptide repeat-containing protein [Parabacteroides distasonis]|uniref:pentapeptide repeat-containing protein n=1 Tax=Parabacteroides distasonis TaxID=823 RepID=UPI003219E8EB